MDHNHRLEAPDNEALKDIEQVADHSDLSTLYRKAKDQWDGELLTDQEREKRRQNKYDTISFGIRKKFLLIGFLIPLPFFLAWLIGSVALNFVTDDNVSMMAIPAIFVFLAWAMLSFFSYKRLFVLFYDNALNAGLFITVLLTLLGLSAVSIFKLSDSIHQAQVFESALTVTGFGFVWSVILTIPLLYLWSTPRLSGNAKLGVIALIGLALAGIAAYVHFLI